MVNLRKPCAPMLAAPLAEDDASPEAYTFVLLLFKIFFQLFLHKKNNKNVQNIDWSSVRKLRWWEFETQASDSHGSLYSSEVLCMGKSYWEHSVLGRFRSQDVRTGWGGFIGWGGSRGKHTEAQFWGGSNTGANFHTKIHAVCLKEGNRTPTSPMQS